MYSVISTAENKGPEIGREGGREEERINNARKLKQLGVAWEVISQVTGLSEEEVDRL